MNRPHSPWSTAAVLLTAVTAMPAMSGCGYLKAIAALTAPDTEKVPAEFNRLSGNKVVIFVYAPPDTLWDYPKVRLDLAAHVASYLKENVKNVEIVDPFRVESYMEQGNRFEMDPLDIGQYFRADMVLHLSVLEFSMRDPEMAHFHRGRIQASVVVYDRTKTDQPPERNPLHDVLVVFPEEGPVGFANATPDQIRKATYEAFAVEVGRKFHAHERPVS